MLIDSHCHLDYFEADHADILARARTAGVGHLLTISTTLAGFPGVRAIAEASPHVSCTVGTHPHNADQEPHTSPEELLALADHPKVIGIGECGLDYFYTKSSPENQAKVFRTHLRACVEGGYPVIIHARDADEDMAQILREESQGTLTGVLHCFSSGRDLALTGLDLGLYISLSGIVTFPKSNALREIVREVPVERLLVETDAPYLAPQPFRGKRCEPAMVVETAKVLANLKGLSPAELATQTTANFQALFPRAVLATEDAA